MRSIKSFEKGLQILETIAQYPEGARVKDISEDVPEPIANMTLFLNSLQKTGFVVKNLDNNRYSVSRKITRIVEMIGNPQYEVLRVSAETELQKLSTTLNENVLLAVLNGNEIQFIERIQARRSVQILQSQDTHFPPHVSAGGKAILAFLESERIAQYMESCLYHRFTEKSLVNPRMLRHELTEIRERGFAVNRGEYETEIMAVSAPILFEKEAVGSVVVQFPTFRYAENNLTQFAEKIMEAARSTEERMRVREIAVLSPAHETV